MAHAGQSHGISQSLADLREDTVIRPDGAKGIYSVVEIRPSCGVVAINDDNQIALADQWRYVHKKYSIEIPAGGSEQDETSLDAEIFRLAHLSHKGMSKLNCAGCHSLTPWPR